MTLADGIQLEMPVDADLGELLVYRITLPFLPPSKNVYDGWPGMWKSSAKKKWIRHIAAACEAQMIPKGNEQVGLAAQLVFATKARRDYANYAQALWHWAPDALVRCGVLVDDSEHRIEYGPNLGLEFLVDKRPIPAKDRQRTILTVAFRA